MRNNIGTFLIPDSKLSWFAPILLVAVGLLGQFLFQSFIVEKSFLLIYPAIAIGCFFGNRYSTLIATFVGAIGAALWFFPAQTNAQTYFGLCIYLGYGIVVSFLSDYIGGMRSKIDLQHEISLQRMKREKENSNAELSDVLDCISDAFFTLDKNWRLVRVNAEYERTGNVKREDRLGKDFREIMIEKGVRHTKYWTEYHRVMEERVEVRFEDYYPTSQTWTECRAFPTPDGGIAVFFTDITKRKHLENQILESESRALKEAERSKLNEEKFKILANSIPQLAWMATPDGEIYWYNDKWYEYTGTNFEEMKGWGWEKVHNPNLLPKMLPLWKESLETGKPWEDKFQIKSKNGEFRWFLSRALPLRDGSGKITSWFGTNTDIEETMRAQLELSRAQLEIANERFKLEQIFQNAPAAKALWVGEDLVFEKVNPQYQALFPDIELLGKPFLEALPEFEGQQIVELIKNVLHTGVPFYGKQVLTWHRRSKNGPIEERYYDFCYIQIKTPEGNPYGVYDHAIDVTDKVIAARKLEVAAQELEKSKLEAERANELKSAFLANMSHEIRTPLGAMVGFADLLRDPNLSREEHDSFIDILTRNGEQLSAIINDILDLSKVEAGHLTLEFLETNPYAVAADVLSLLSLKANEKGIKLDFIAESTTPGMIVSDPVRLKQILMNVVSNAVKFTSEGSVKVRSFGSTSNERKMLYFEVTDSGIGITSTEVERIFEPFVQADRSHTRKFGGTGLGLALSRQLARSLGGDVTLSQTVQGVGTTFLIAIETQPQRQTFLSERIPRESLLKIPEKILDNVKVLVVDDSADNRQLISLYLNKFGASVDSAEDGELGFKKALTGHHDVVLMDIQMPIMDGFTATAKLRESGFKAPIIALTAHAMNEVRQKCINVGCTDHLSKPIKSKELIAAVAKYSGNL